MSLLRSQTRDGLRDELEQVRARPAESEATLRAVRTGGVDAILVNGPRGNQIFTLESPEEPYRILAEGMSEGAATLTVEGTILFCNRRLSLMAKLPPEQLLGSSFLTLLNHQQGPAFSELLHRALTNNVRLESQLLRHDGTVVPIQLSLSLILFKEHEQAICLVATDLSERSRAEAQRDRLAAVVESSDDAIISKTLDGTINAWNRGAEKVFGYSQSEVVGQPMLMLFPPDRVTEETEILARIQRGESVEHFETVRVRKDGKNIDVSVTISPIRDNGGSIIGASKIARDITERKRAAAALAAQAEELSRQTEELISSREALGIQTLMLQSVLDSMAEGLVATDEQGHFILWNAAAKKILGHGAAELPSHEWSKHYGLYLDDQATTFPADQLPLVRALRGESCTTEMFVRNSKLDQGVWIEVSGGPLKDKEGTLLGSLAAFRDITQNKKDEHNRQQAEGELARKAAELARSNADLEQFAYVASHDLQEPLRMVTAYTQLLGERYRGKLDANADKFIGYASEGALRMQVLIQDLLAFSRVSRSDAAGASIDCNAVMQQVLQALSSAIEESRAIVTWKTLPTIWADRTQMTQVFQNLVGNAIKFRGQEPPVISVHAEKAYSHWMFSVSDNGIGIAPESAEQIFIVFQRLHARAEYPGNGIGLAICKKIVERAGGRIWVESQPGFGSTFKFTMPVLGSTSYGSDEREGVHDEIRTPAAVGG
ncbi:MAG: PAS domain S-box protein [Candidatus Sulfotelmatobacter sp.]